MRAHIFVDDDDDDDCNKPSFMICDNMSFDE